MEFNHKTIVEEFHDLEKLCIGFDNYINCSDEAYTDTLEKLRKLVLRI